MATTFTFLSLFFLLITSLVAARPISQSENQMRFQYHDGPLLTGQLTVNLIWYGTFKPAQWAIITDFLGSLSSPGPVARPAVASWWASLSKFYKKPATTPSISMGKHFFDDGCSLGKSLTRDQITALATTNGTSPSSISVVLTAPDVAVEGFCMSSCGSHGSYRANKGSRAGYIWVGNSETQCPAQCAWPFHQPIYGPQGPPLAAPNGDVGMDGIVMNLAGLMAGTVTNPFGNGYFQGPKDAPLEAASACPGVYGSGAYPGYAGELLVDPTSGASYNANGIDGRKYLLPALFDPATHTCSTLV